MKLAANNNKCSVVFLYRCGKRRYILNTEQCGQIYANEKYLT